MTFAASMVGFLVFMAGVVWAAVVVGIPQQYIAIGVAVLLVIGIVAAAMLARRSPPRRR